MKARVRVEVRKLPQNASYEDHRRNLENSIRVFRRAVGEYKIEKYYKQHEYYEKPSEKRRRKAQERQREIDRHKSGNS